MRLDFINKLRPVSYRWNTGIDNDFHYDQIAKEAEQVIEEMGKGEKTSIITHDEPTDHYGVRYLSRAIRSSKSGWVENSLRNPPVLPEIFKLAMAVCSSD